MDKLLVRDVHTRHPDVHIAVGESTPLEELVKRMAVDPSVQIIFVVNKDRVYRGTITRRDLLNYIAMKLVGGKSTSSMSVGAMSRIVFAAKAGDLSRGGDQPPPVTEDTDLAIALGRMIDSEQPVLPVLDDNRKLLGDLRLSEILNASLEASADDVENKS